MKKNIFTFAILLLVFTSQGFADTELISSPDRSLIWSAAILNNHNYFNKESCSASVESRTIQGSRKATLEMLALRELATYQQATVMVRVEKAFGDRTDFHNGEIRVENMGAIKRYSLLRAEIGQNSETQLAALPQIDERKALIADLQAGRSAEVVLYKNGAVVETMTFSLRGSTAATKSIIQNCVLSLQ
ncbi:MAG: hypothetical protein ACAH59_11270 [Pseudobdellovibrionaceae bacterium]